MQAGVKSETAPMKPALNAIVFGRITMIAKLVINEAGNSDMHSKVELLANLLDLVSGSG